MNTYFTCNIFLDAIKNNKMCPKCQKIFCSSCIEQWLNSKKSCPCCRSPMHFDNLGALNWLEEAIKEDKRIAKERKDLEEQNDALKQKVLEMVEEQAKMKTMHDKAITKNTRDTIDLMLD